MHTNINYSIKNTHTNIKSTEDMHTIKNSTEDQYERDQVNVFINTTDAYVTYMERKWNAPSASKPTTHKKA